MLVQFPKRHRGRTEMSSPRRVTPSSILFAKGGGCLGWLWTKKKKQKTPWKGRVKPPDRACFSNTGRGGGIGLSGFYRLNTVTTRAANAAVEQMTTIGDRFSTTRKWPAFVSAQSSAAHSAGRYVTLSGGALPCQGRYVWIGSLGAPSRVEIKPSAKLRL